MKAAILSQDILAICLFIADGDIDVTLEQVTQGVEDYQKIQKRHFGISRSDFRRLFDMWLSLELGVRGLGDEFDGSKLSDIVYDILDYHDAYLNDEGESWSKSKDKEFDRWYGYDEDRYNGRMEIRKTGDIFLS